jgi:putative membrane protein
MIVHHSDNYPAAHFRAAIIVSFLFSLGLYFSPLDIINPIYFLWIQLPGLFLGYWLGHFSFIKKLLISKTEINEEVNQKAIESFFHHNVHLTKQHVGVLIFISVMEKRIKIITDSGIAKKVEQKVWDQIVLQFAEEIEIHDFSIGLKNCIEAAANVLERHFPIDNTKITNELDNNLIIESESESESEK